MSGSRRKAIRDELTEQLGRPPTKHEMRLAKHAHTKLHKRVVWRPVDSAGQVVRGGARGFHLPQLEDRFSYIKPRPKPKRRARKKAAAA